jgi:hypothetical protein
MFCQLVERDVVTLFVANGNTKYVSNCSKIQREMLHSSSKNPNLIFKGCDKGGGLAIINRSYYDGEIHRQMFVTYSYRKLKGDPTCVYKTNIHFFFQQSS